MIVQTNMDHRTLRSCTEFLVHLLYRVLFPNLRLAVICFEQLFRGNSLTLGGTWNLYLVWACSSDGRFPRNLSNVRKFLRTRRWEQHSQEKNLQAHCLLNKGKNWMPTADLMWGIKRGITPMLRYPHLYHRERPATNRTAGG